MDRPSVPRPGRTIFSLVQPWAQPISAAFTKITRSAAADQQEEYLWQRYCRTFYPFVPSVGLPDLLPETKVRLCVSAILGEWMLYRTAHPSATEATVETAEQWFLGCDRHSVPGLLLGSDWASPECYPDFRGLAFGEKFLDLLPYILEWFDTIMTDGRIPSKETIRLMRRKLGMVYTPSDVADFIAKRAVEDHAKKALETGECEDKLGILDPACGTGIFLRSALGVMRAIPGRGHNTLDLVQCLYGMDINPQAIQSCAFVLTSQCLSDLRDNCLSPWRAWQVIRSNLAVLDSTLVSCDNTETECSSLLRQLRKSVRRELLNPARDSQSLSLSATSSPYRRDSGSCAGSYLLGGEGPHRLDALFPECSTGFTTVLGNPPYSELPRDSQSGLRAAYFDSAPSSGERTSKYYPLFVEMMWKLGNVRSSSAGIVVPLSVAYSSSPAIRRLRTAIQRTPGVWAFSFFDRTPDSLFGDDVKTRNAVIIYERSPDSSHSEIVTGPLIRWSSRSRAGLFERLTNVPITGVSIQDLVPKLGDPVEAAIYERVNTVKDRLLPLFECSGAASYSEDNQSRFIYYSSVAYNWIPVFRFCPLSTTAGVERPSIRALDCGNQRHAWLVFACISSRLAYWLWRVKGDGFHVTRRFIDCLPFHPQSFDEQSLSQLVSLAEALWQKIQKYPVESINKGRKTVSYCPYACNRDLDLIDRILLRKIGLSDDHARFLAVFVRENTIAGRHDELHTNRALERLTTEED